MDIFKLVSGALIPAAILLILITGMVKNIGVYDCFIQGAEDGLKIVFKIVPAIIGLMVAIAMLRASGAMELLAFALKPVLASIGMPPDVLPLALMRPFSGSASLGIVGDILKTNGPDSYAGRVASVMMGSTETTFYTLTVYFGAAGIKDIRYALKAALIGDLAGMLASLWACHVFF